MRFARSTQGFLGIAVAVLAGCAGPETASESHEADVTGRATGRLLGALDAPREIFVPVDARWGRAPCTA